jgi:ribulose-5-phosphate 4-epimerase/fuculose-1-phosphate aldolase
MNGLTELAHMSRVLGKDPLLVQAGGGNISVKFSNRRMAIKASGYRLREVTVHRGWTWADIAQIQRGFRRLSHRRSTVRSEMAYADLLKKSGSARRERMSMEAGFHAVLPQTYVAHVHSVTGILLGLLSRPKALKLIGRYAGKNLNVCSVAPRLPGLELMLDMSKQETASSETTTLWLQRNHGLVWASSRGQDILYLSSKFEKGLRHHFKLARYPAPHVFGTKNCRRPKHSLQKISGATELCFCQWPSCVIDFRPLFPDFIIYFDLWSRTSPDLIHTGPRTVEIHAATPQALQDKREVLYAHVLVGTLASKNHCLKTLPVSVANTIKNLETERQRVRQIQAR